MSKTLFQISSELQAIINMLEESGGETSEEIDKALEIRQVELAQKSESYLYVRHEAMKKIEMANEWKNRADEYIKHQQKTIDRLETALLNATLTFGPIEAGINTVKTRKSSGAKIVDADKIPKEYRKTKITESIDGKKVLKDLRAGKKVPGAELDEKENLKIN